MYNLYQALSGNNLNQGIQNFNVFYDTLFLNFKVCDPATNANYNYLLIEKLNFDYSTVSFNTNTKNYIINFGNTNSNLPLITTTGNTLVDNILLEKEKIVLICGLSAGNTSATSIGNEIYNGTFFCPIVFKYDINNNSLLKIYPLDSDIPQWNTLLFGNFLSSQNPLVSYNSETKTINYIFVSIMDMTNPTSTNIKTINDIELSYNNNNCNINNVQILSTYQSVDDSTINIVKFKNYNNNEKLVSMQTNANNGVLLFSLQ